MIHHGSNILLDAVPITVYWDFIDHGPDEPFEVKITRISILGGKDNLLEMTGNEEGRPDEPLINSDDLENLGDEIAEEWSRPRRKVRDEGRRKSE